MAVKATPERQGSAGDAGRLARIVLTGESLARLSPEREAERAQAAADLATENRFAPVGFPAGPFELHLSIQEGRLVLDVRDAVGQPLIAHAIALGPLRSLIRDYLMLLDAHDAALADGREARIEAIDMGRRGLHDEAAALLIERLDGKISIDFATGRRLFTLIIALHQRS